MLKWHARRSTPFSLTLSTLQGFSFVLGSGAHSALKSGSAPFLFPVSLSLSFVFFPLPSHSLSDRLKGSSDSVFFCCVPLTSPSLFFFFRFWCFCSLQLPGQSSRVLLLSCLVLKCLISFTRLSVFLWWFGVVSPSVAFFFCSFRFAT